ncbi:hypothetical protein ACG9X8_05105, partial [Acinetobacter nosocomialis]|uniref:hypothetical protein n=1 Tax=Acinetobacter nosocomialis TaxID=106654 RepID=UPI003AF7FC28
VFFSKFVGGVIFELQPVKQSKYLFFLKKKKSDSLESLFLLRFLKYLSFVYLLDDIYSVNYL